MDELALEVIPEDSKGIVIAATERINLRLRRTAEDIVLVGQDLKMIKDSLDQGQFSEWISDNFDMTHRTANNFINVYSKFHDRLDMIDHLKPSILYQLSAPSTPDEVVDEVTKMEKNPTLSEFEALKNQVKKEEVKRKRAEDNRDLVMKQADDRIGEANREVKTLQDKMKNIGEIKDRVEIIPEGYVDINEIPIKSALHHLEESYGLLQQVSIPPRGVEEFDKAFQFVQNINSEMRRLTEKDS
jgi:hypothetical protein